MMEGVSKFNLTDSRTRHKEQDTRDDKLKDGLLRHLS